MTKNAVILLTAVCQLIFLNISTNLFVTAVQTTEAPKDESKYLLRDVCSIYYIRVYTKMVE